jgi:hypothetical protein
MSDTPRTKAASRMAFSGEYMVEIEEAQKIERELADMTKQRDALAEALREMLKFTPHSLVCQDFHHPTKDCHSESEDCQPTKRFRDALAKAEQALAATKGGIDE